MDLARVLAAACGCAVGYCEGFLVAACALHALLLLSTVCYASQQKTALRAQLRAKAGRPVHGLRARDDDTFLVLHQVI